MHATRSKDITDFVCKERASFKTESLNSQHRPGQNIIWGLPFTGYERGPQVPIIMFRLLDPFIQTSAMRSVAEANSHLCSWRTSELFRAEIAVSICLSIGALFCGCPHIRALLFWGGLYLEPLILGNSQVEPETCSSFRFRPMHRHASSAAATPLA